MSKNSENLLEISDLKTVLDLDEGKLIAVNGVDLLIKKEKTLGIVGESGCGKSMLAQTILRIEPKFAKIVGKIKLFSKNDNYIDLVKFKRNATELNKVRGDRISMIFQEPMTAFSALHTIGNQLKEAIYLHKTKDKKYANEIAIQTLNKVGISNPTQRLKEYHSHRITLLNP